MPELPAKLAELLEEFAGYDRNERAELLLHYADRFREVPPEIATRPFPEAHRAPQCESAAYVWAVDRPDGTLQFHFAVESPQGISARAWSVILDDTLSGAPLAEVAAISQEVMFTIFGREVSMGRGLGLIGMLDMVTSAARRRLAQRRAPRESPGR